MSTLDFLYDDYNSRYNLLKENKSSLVHYTGLDGALGILKGQNLWLRKITLMNDSSEFSYGQELVKNWAIRNKAALAALSEKLQFDFFRMLTFQDSTHWETIKENTYSISLSEHLSHEDKLGRLSMWRGYGRAGGVALVVDPRFLEDEDEKSSAHSLPARYWDMNDIDQFLGDLGHKLYELNTNTLDRGTFADEVYFSFLLFLMSVKHPGFLEEREWRLVANLNTLGSKLLSEATVKIHNENQSILRFDLNGEGMYNIKNSLKKIIIGPSEVAEESSDELKQALACNKIDVPIIISDIPFREY